MLFFCIVLSVIYVPQKISQKNIKEYEMRNCVRVGCESVRDFNNRISMTRRYYNYVYVVIVLLVFTYAFKFMGASERKVFIAKMAYEIDFNSEFFCKTKFVKPRTKSLVLTPDHSIAYLVSESEIEQFEKKYKNGKFSSNKVNVVNDFGGDHNLNKVATLESSVLGEIIKCI